jgi:hypothetical protein
MHLIFFSGSQIREPNFRGLVGGDDSVSDGGSWGDIGYLMAELRGGERLTGYCFFSDKSI